jgi:hypothetical protein
MLESGNVREPSVYAGKTYVGYFVQLAQAVHYLLAQLRRPDFRFATVVELLLNV